MGDSERGKPASFNPRSGEVHGSGADSGGGGGGREDYDQDSAAGSGQEPPLGPGDAGADRPVDPKQGA
jgi:hypothetical protein